MAINSEIESLSSLLKESTEAAKRITSVQEDTTRSL
jgi:hypothetical protein